MTIVRRGPAIFCLALGILLCAAPCRAAAGEPRPHVLELGAWAGYALPLGKAVADERGGRAVGVQIRYRSPSGLGAFIEGGYAPLFSSRGRIAGIIPGRTVGLSSSLNAWLVTGGLAVDWRFLRLDGGLGLGILSVRSTLDGVTISPLQLDLVYTVAATAFFIDRVVRLGAGVRAVFASSSGINFLVFTLNLGGDVLRRR
jgi:hypothetical protein